MSNDRCARWPRNIFKQKTFPKLSIFYKKKTKKSIKNYRQQRKIDNKNKKDPGMAFLLQWQEIMKVDYDKS